jgi:hypothetical protein
VANKDYRKLEGAGRPKPCKGPIFEKRQSFRRNYQRKLRENKDLTKDNQLVPNKYIGMAIMLYLQYFIFW